MISAKDIDKLLPQTQCEECGYPGCMPYAQAIAAGVAEINLCPPGGVKTIINLGQLLKKDVANYIDLAEKNYKKPITAVIREEDCIGCTKCISACPVDAIIGSAKHMHTILDFECTGCGMCIEPCPVDCIDLIDVNNLAKGEYAYNPDVARHRHEAKIIRGIQAETDKNNSYLLKRKLAEDSFDKKADNKAKQEYILKALQRSSLKKTHKI
jgi:electron transport complex protein RnfB